MESLSPPWSWNWSEGHLAGRPVGRERHPATAGRHPARAGAWGPWSTRGTPSALPGRPQTGQHHRPPGSGGAVINDWASRGRWTKRGRRFLPGPGTWSRHPRLHGARARFMSAREADIRSGSVLAGSGDVPVHHGTPGLHDGANVVRSPSPSCATPSRSTASRSPPSSATSWRPVSPADPADPLPGARRGLRALANAGRPELSGAGRAAPGAPDNCHFSLAACAFTTGSGDRVGLLGHHRADVDRGVHEGGVFPCRTTSACSGSAPVLARVVDRGEGDRTRHPCRRTRRRPLANLPFSPSLLAGSRPRRPDRSETDFRPCLGAVPRRTRPGDHGDVQVHGTC